MTKQLMKLRLCLFSHGFLLCQWTNLFVIEYVYTADLRIDAVGSTEWVVETRSISPGSALRSTSLIHLPQRSKAALAGGHLLLMQHSEYVAVQQRK